MLLFAIFLTYSKHNNAMHWKAAGLPFTMGANIVAMTISTTLLPSVAPSSDLKH
ncbi:hypothetical protein OAQ34_01740 [Opitutales bacterium]|nr:hypothetical protein [Opitutales bacterium]